MVRAMSKQSRSQKRECGEKVLPTRLCFLLIFLVAVQFVLASPHCDGQETNLVSISLESAGARYGLPANNEARGLQEAEIFSNYYLPWLWPFGRFEVQSRLDLTLGWIGDHTQNAFMGTVGPSLQFRWRNFPIELDFGSSPTLLSTHELGELDIGTQVQFTSHAGIDWNITRHVRLGYRFTHMSNAGIREPNPGVNMHMFALSVVF